MSTTFLFKGRPIPMDIYRPRGAGDHPAVIVLHGSGGFKYYTERDAYAQMLAEAGFTLYLPHYFEATGTAWADEPTIYREFPTWMEVVQQAITNVAAQQNGRGPRIALMGFSLGAYLALGVASRDERVRAVVDVYGGMPAPLVAGVERMPPTMILHGEEDDVVPVREAHTVARLLDEKKVPYEMTLYPGAGHVFSMTEMLDAAPRILGFLKKHLE